MLLPALLMVRIPGIIDMEDAKVCLLENGCAEL